LHYFYTCSSRLGEKWEKTSYTLIIQKNNILSFS
jgi:hypothetical protein